MRVACNIATATDGVQNRLQMSLQLHLYVEYDIYCSKLYIVPSNNRCVRNPLTRRHPTNHFLLQILQHYYN